MPDLVAPAPITQEPTKIPPPTQAGSQGAAALIDEPKKKEEIPEDPFEFELDVKGQKQKLKFDSKDQLKAVLQKALYADQIIKDASQAKKGAESLMQKLKTPQGVREVLSDPDINLDVKKFALEIVREMMDDEKLTPEQREAREWRTKAEKLEAEKKARDEFEEQKKAQEKAQAHAQQIRTEIIEAMKKYPDIPQTQATMDAVIQNMRAGFRRFGKHLTAEQAMTVYSQQYWNSLSKIIENMEADQLLKRFPQKTLDKIQQFKLNQLKEKTNPAKKETPEDGEIKKKKSLTEKDFERHFSKNIAPLAGL